MSNKKDKFILSIKNSKGSLIIKEEGTLVVTAPIIRLINPEPDRCSHQS